MSVTCTAWVLGQRYMCWPCEMESENIDKCVALESVAKQDNGKRDSMMGSSITRMCTHVHAHTTLWETMSIITLPLTCVF